MSESTAADSTTAPPTPPKEKVNTSPVAVDIANETDEETAKRVWKIFRFYLREKKTFNAVYDGSLNIVTASKEGKATFEFQVKPEYTNVYGTLHGGVIGSLIDICSGGAVMALINAPFGVTSQSLDMNMSFIAAAKEGDVVRIESVILKSGKSVAFTETTMFVGDKLIAKGSHTMIAAAPR
ncbi:HotDog domain-containing protein [Cladochytrium replicatum]|nr:HotDog domain-containing protein [Cladochytrium replicatum]